MLEGQRTDLLAQSFTCKDQKLFKKAPFFVILKEHQLSLGFDPFFFTWLLTSNQREVNFDFLNSSLVLAQKCCLKLTVWMSEQLIQGLIGRPHEPDFDENKSLRTTTDSAFSCCNLAAIAAFGSCNLDAHFCYRR